MSSIDKPSALTLTLMLTGKAVEEAIEALDDEEIEVPNDLDRKIRNYLAKHPDEPWHEAVQKIGVLNERALQDPGRLPNRASLLRRWHAYDPRS